MPKRLIVGLWLALLITMGSATITSGQSPQEAPSAPAPAPTITLHPDWQMQVVATGLSEVDNLAIGPQGGLFATLEMNGGKGQIQRLSATGSEVIMTQLNRADGLIIHGQHLFITEEVDNGRVLMVGLSSGKTVTLGRFRHPEGITMLADGALAITEDRTQGRLLRLAADGSVSVLAEGLRRPEGIAVAADGTIYVAETSTGRVLAYQNGTIRVVQDGIVEPDQVTIGPAGNLWVTEDRNPGRLLRINLGDGAAGVTVIAANLNYPQGIIFKGPTLLLAEQGRHRILTLSPRPK